MKGEVLRETEISSPLLDPYLVEFKQGPQTWGPIFKEIGKQLNIETEYVKEQSPLFKDMRRQLDTEAGMLIANHPSSLDFFFVFPTLTRQDVLCMTQRKRFPFLEQTFGSKYVVQVPEGVGESLEATKRIEEHISSGGLFILFPSGGEEIATGVLRFKSGFRHFLSRLSPESMIYAMHIDPKAGETIMKNVVGAPPKAGGVPELIAPNLHVRPNPEILRVLVDETYTQTADWQKVLREQSTTAGDEEKDPLTQHYLRLFGLGN